ncbi:hypothetical protein V7x_10650 [Crateriforma conspicua]|uniref:Uncharacterized protein n=1 Tax=Crateriforma conspicua TaxID=2527996 RepID=A0A5C5Y7P4_9PLAN|nr:hypothetical protein Mal65_42730 [Crateriforma conspicua]TWT70501.1 hypothetical protein Pan14r_28070 [Crateriforma conspicua]TWU65517.1 hypothetical protein V7x_10650 [Crateriforma conspicua]
MSRREITVIFQANVGAVRRPDNDGMIRSVRLSFVLTSLTFDQRTTG